MAHVVLVGLILLIGVGWWYAVHSSPWILSMVLPKRLVFTIGLVFLVTAAFSAFIAASTLRNPELFLGCVIQGFVGSWFMLAPMAAMRGTVEYEQLMRRLALMFGAVTFAIFASLYIQATQLLALVNLALIIFGTLLTTRHLRSQRD